MKWLPAIALCILSLALPALAQSPYPAGPISNRPNDAYEEETKQVGGKGIWNYYSFVGALRCPGANDAIVGIYSRRGSILDYVQILCATVSCGPQGCGWRQSRFGPAKGNPSGGTIANTDVCPVNYVVAGFRGGSAGWDSYATDIQPECALLNGGRTGTDQVGGRQNIFSVLPVGNLDNNRRDKRGNFGQTGYLRYTAPPRTYTSHAAFSSSDNQRICSCTGDGATALSVAIGRWNLGYQAVQAFSMFCGNTDTGATATSCRLSSDR